jgi:serine/threonine protein kinase
MIEAETGDYFSLLIPQHFGNYTFHQVIGQGSTCVVIEATDQSSGKDYAVKVMSYSYLADRNFVARVKQEISILRSHTHDNIVRFHDFIHQDDLLFLVTENCTGGDILTWITEGRTADSQTRKRLFHDIVLGVQYLHLNGIAHNDIKPENVIIDSSGRVKLADFGYAKTQLFASDDEKNGTLMYAAPELLRPGDYHTQKADLWSLGILLYVMTTGKFPFNGTTEQCIVQQICRGDLRYTKSIDAEVEQLVRRLTKVNPNERPTIDELLQDSFFDDIRGETPKVAQNEVHQMKVEVDLTAETLLW